METRPYFLLGDLVANVLAGAFIGAVHGGDLRTRAGICGWRCFVGMALAMPLSMVIAFPMGALFGAMEVMVPVMTTGMVVSMWVAMEAAMAPIPILEGARMGVYGGIATLFALLCGECPDSQEDFALDLVTKAKWDKAARNFDVMAGYGPEKRWAPVKAEALLEDGERADPVPGDRNGARRPLLSARPADRRDRHQRPHAREGAGAL